MPRRPWQCGCGSSLGTRRRPEQASRKRCCGRKQTRRLPHGRRGCGPGCTRCSWSPRRATGSSSRSRGSSRQPMHRGPRAGPHPAGRVSVRLLCAGNRRAAGRNPSAGPRGPPAASEARRVSTCARLSLAAHGVASRGPPLPPAPRVAPAPRARGSLSAVASSLDVPRCSLPAPSSPHAQGTWEATALGPCVLRPGPCALFSAGRSGREAFFPSVFPAVETLSSSAGRREPPLASTGRSRPCQAHHRARRLACKSEGKWADVNPTQTEEGP